MKANKINKNFKNFLIKLFIFLILTLFILPGLINYFTPIFELNKYPFINFYNLKYFFIAAIILFIIKNKEKIKKSFQKQNIKQTILFSTLVLIFFIFYLNIGKFIETLYLKHNIISQTFNYLSTYLLYIFIIISTFIATFNLNFIKKYWKSLSLTIIFSAIYYFIVHLLYKNLHWVVRVISRQVYFLLNIFYENINLIFKPQTLEPVLTLKNFTAIIGETCSGIDLMIMFLLLFGIFIFIKWEKLKKQEKHIVENKTQAIIILLLGLVGTIYLNVIRISILMIIGTYNPELAVSFFHNHSGWFLFFIYFIVLIIITNKLLD